MKLIRTFSHLNGEEHLIVNRPTLYRELIGLLRESRLRTLENSRNLLRARLLQDFTETVRLLAQMAGWQETAMGFDRERISMSIHIPFGDESLPYGLLFAERLWSYAIDKIDVGVEILPTLERGVARRTKKSTKRPADGFIGAISTIRRSGRNVPPVPLLLVGITL